MQREDPGFSFTVLVDGSNTLECAVWMTGSQRKRLQLFGDVIFLDATHVNVKEKFQLFLPSVLNQDKRLHRVCFAVAETENATAINFVLKSMKEMCLGWENETVFMDSKVSAASIQDVLPNSQVHYCTWHWLEQDLKVRLHAIPDYPSMKQHVRAMMDCVTEQSYEELWTEFQHKFPQAVSYMSHWHAKRQNWARPWTYRAMTLGCHASSPSESSNAAFKAWMTESDACLFSLFMTR